MYQVGLNKLNRRRKDNTCQYLLPQYKIIHQTDMIGGLRKYYSTPDLKDMDANLYLLNKAPVNKAPNNRGFVNNIFFVQEYLIEKAFIQTHLAKCMRDDKEYFFNKFEKTISSTIEYNFFKKNTNHFAIDYNKFKNKDLKKLVIEIFEKIEEEEYNRKKSKEKTQDKKRHHLVIQKMMEKVNKIKRILHLN